MTGGPSKVLQATVDQAAALIASRPMQSSQQRRYVCSFFVGPVPYIAGVDAPDKLTAYRAFVQIMEMRAVITGEPGRLQRVKELGTEISDAQFARTCAEVRAFKEFNAMPLAQDTDRHYPNRMLHEPVLPSSY